MPYVYAQSKDCTQRGLPMMRALFVEFPNDPGAWQIENQYMFGADILVAPLLEEGIFSRNIYLPIGNWIDYQTGISYIGGAWHKIDATHLPVIMLVKDGAVIPHIHLAQSTAMMDWSNIDLVAFSTAAATAKGKIFLPTDTQLSEITLSKKASKWTLTNDPYKGKTKLKLFSFTDYPH